MPTQNAVSQRELHKALLTQKRQLEQELEKAEGRSRWELRLKLAAVSEDLVLSNRRLHELMPRHKISAPAAGEMRSVEREVFGEEDPEQAELHRVTKLALERTCTSLEREAIQRREHVRWQKQVAEEMGSTPSATSKRLKRTRRKTAALAEPAFCLRRHARKNGGLIDLRDDEQLRAYLKLLTDRQQVYVTLYYGEWLTCREIAELLGIDQSTVSRTIRRALGRLTVALDGETRVEGMERLEDLLTEQFCLVERDCAVEKEITLPSGRRKAHHKPSEDTAQRFGLWLSAVPLYISGGGLRQWLQDLRQKTGTKKGIRRALEQAFAKIKELIGARNYVDHH